MNIWGKVHVLVINTVVTFNTCQLNLWLRFEMTTATQPPHPRHPHAKKSWSKRIVDISGNTTLQHLK